MNRLYIHIAALALLTGCHGLFRPGVKNTLNYPAYTYIGAGQSNMSKQELSQTFHKSINVAESGSHITQWQKGTPFYANMLAACQTPGPIVLLWWQGEAEGYSGGSGEWTNNFLKMVHDLREDTGNYIPVVYVQIGHFLKFGANIEGDAWHSVSDQQAALNGREALYMVSIKDIAPEDDGLHYDSSYKQIQERMLQAVLDNIH